MMKLLGEILSSNIKINPNNENNEDNETLVINIDEEYNYENIVKNIKNLKIENEYELQMIKHLKDVNFIDNKKYINTSINYISWITKDEKVYMKICNGYKAKYTHYYEFKLM